MYNIYRYRTSVKVPLTRLSVALHNARSQKSLHSIMPGCGASSLNLFFDVNGDPDLTFHSKADTDTDPALAPRQNDANIRPQASICEGPLPSFLNFGFNANPDTNLVYRIRITIMLCYFQLILSLNRSIIWFSQSVTSLHIVNWEYFRQTWH